MKDSKRVAEVPGDYLLEANYDFTPVSYGKVRDNFHICHLVSEGLYQGDGMWVESLNNPFPPTIRQTSRRVIGYIKAFQKTRDEIYKIRAMEGLDYLLREQGESGEYPWYRRSNIGVINQIDCLYDTGIAGIAFLYGYEAFREDSYFRASQRAADWAVNAPVCWNYNYNMFAAWHLAEHYECSQDEKYLMSAIEKTGTTLDDQEENGRWLGHNSWIWYHGIILRGLARLYGVLPRDNDKLRQRVRACMIKGINRLIIDQQEDGSIPPNPDEDEYRFRPPNKNAHRDAFVLQALCLVGKYTDLCVDNIINGLVKYRCDTEIDIDIANQYKDSTTVEGSWKARLLRKEERAYNENMPNESISCDDLADKGIRISKSSFPYRLSSEKILWSEGFCEFDNVAGWGELPKRAFVCWYPCRKPEEGRAVFKRENHALPGKFKYEVSTETISGFGYDLSYINIALEENVRYRLSCRMKVKYDSSYAHKFKSIYMSAYSGKPRSKWDMATNCQISVCRPLDKDFFYTALWFEAKGRDNYIYISVDTDKLDLGEKVTLIIDSIELVKECNIVEQKRVLPYNDYDCSVMCMGEYLGYI